MASYLEMSREEQLKEFAVVKAEYERLRSMHLSLDMSRGKPGFDNMDLSEKMFDLVGNDTGFKNISRSHQLLADTHADSSTWYIIAQN